MGIRSKIVTVGAAAALLLGLAVVAGPVASGSSGSSRGLIAFSSGFILIDPDVENPSQVFTVRPDGSQLRQLTHVPDGKHAGAPDISRDGSKIAYVSDVSGSFAVWAMNRDGTHQHRLFGRAGYDYFQPRWSPDGTRLLVTRCHQIGFATPCDIVLTDSDGSPQRVLVGGGRVSGNATFSPDGKWIAFDSDRGGFIDAVWVMRVSGGRPTRVSAPNLEAFWPGWSPDGSRLTISDNCCRPASNVYSVRTNGSSLRKLTHVTQGGGSGFSSYSPDGKHIVFISDKLRGPDFDRSDLFVMNADGTNQHRIVSTVPATTPDWAGAGG
jgi:Tol biopolymer transport system component